jgi:hypothetical protein
MQGDISDREASTCVPGNKAPVRSPDSKCNSYIAGGSCRSVKSNLITLYKGNVSADKCTRACQTVG